ncbi:MAG: HIRAN domain-containing protein, partial [Elusimicrobiota bacterium]
MKESQEILKIHSLMMPVQQELNLGIIRSSENIAAFLGEIDVAINGLKYYGYNFSRRLNLFFIRETENPKDYNALRVEDAHARQIGYVSRADASYISPLLDDNRIAIKGRMIDYGDRFSLNACISLYLTKKGLSLLEKDDFIDSEEDLVFEMIRSAYLNMENLDAEKIRAFQLKLAPFLGNYNMPKT